MSKHLSICQAEELLVKLYREQERTVDHLPYTDEFEAMFRQLCNRAAAALSEHQVWEMLIYLRKAGRLDNKEKLREAGRKVPLAGGGLLGMLK